MDELHRLNSANDSTDQSGANLHGFGVRSSYKQTREARRERLAKRTEFPFGALISVTVATAAATVFFGFVGVLLQMDYDACSDPALECNYGYVSVAIWAVPVLGIAAIVSLIVLMFLPNGRLRRQWWLPIILALAPLVGFALCYVLTTVGSGQALH